MKNVEPKSPLTIIAILAGIIEASALASLPFLSDGSQTIYTWFLVGFPFFLTVLFFLTLNFNYRSLYSPPNTATLETPSITSETTPLVTDSSIIETTPTAEQAHGSNETSNLPTGSCITSALARGAPLHDTQTTVTVTVSGASSNQLLEHLAKQALSQSPPLCTTWVLYNPEAGTRTTVDIRPIEA